MKQLPTLTCSEAKQVTLTGSLRVESGASFAGNVEIGGEIKLFNDNVQINRPSTQGPTFEGFQYVPRTTILCTADRSHNSIFFHTPGEKNTALVADGPIISTASGASFAGNVEIGGKLSIKGNLVTDGPIISTESGASFAGNVGIGTTIKPRGKLDVNGQVFVSGEIRVDGFRNLGSDTHLSGSEENRSTSTHWLNAHGQRALGFIGEQKEKHSAYSIKAGSGWTLVCSQKNFQIDHPLNPEAKYLNHSTLEGPEVAVFYRGASNSEH